MFVACYVASIGRILSPVDKGCSGMIFGLKTGVYRSCQGALCHAGAWKPRCGVDGCILWHAGAWKPRCNVAGCILGYAIAWDSTL